MNNNPYIGPRPFQNSDQASFFSREREARELQKLISTHRETLVYGPSGAGKTSLLNARVIPRLAQRGLVVLPVARVGMPLLAETAPGAVKNIFVYAALLSLALDQVDAKSLPEQTLQDALCARLNGAGSAVSAGKQPTHFLIFDQFEELFTAYPDRWADVPGFFDQLRDALEHLPGLGVVFCLREEWMAVLEPYLGQLPGRLRARYRLDLLDVPGALAAVTQPAIAAGVPFDEDAAHHLVEQLRLIRPPRVTSNNGTGPSPSMAPSLLTTAANPNAALPGPRIEPLLLQTVCQRLWDFLPDHTRMIEMEEGLDQALFPPDFLLTDTYDIAVRAAAAAGEVSEVEVRRWFAHQLITPGGTRAILRQDLLETGGLTNLAVVELEDRHLLVAETRAGARWYELAHDRLIAPVLAANGLWEQTRETPLRVTARHWRVSGDRSLLYRGQRLKAAQAWADQLSLHQPDGVEPYEQAFLQASQKAEAAENTWRGWAILGVIALAMMAGFLALAAWNAQQRAVRAKQNELEVQKERVTAVARIQLAETGRATAEASALTAEQKAADASQQVNLLASREDASQARIALNNASPQLSLLLALQGITRSQQAGEPRSVVGEQVLRDTLSVVSGMPLQGHSLGVNNLAGSPDRRWLATVSDDGTLRLWNLLSSEPEKDSIALAVENGWISGVDFSPDGHWLAASGADGAIRVWDMTQINAAQSAGHPREQIAQIQPMRLEGHVGGVEQVHFSPDGVWLASGGADKTVRLWDVSSLDGQKKSIQLIGPTDAVTLIDFSVDNHWLASGSRDGSIVLWDLRAKEIDKSARGLSMIDRVYGLAFSPDGRWLASAGRDQRVILWDLRAPGQQIPSVELGRHSGTVLSLTFSPDGCWLASGGADKKVILWYMGAPNLGDVFYTLTGHTGDVQSLVFPKMVGPREKYQAIRLASGSADHTVRVWDLTPVQVQGKDCQRPLNGISLLPPPMPDARKVDFPVTVLRGLDSAINKLDFVAGNRWLAAAGSINSARLWDLRNLSSSQEPFMYDTSGIGRIYATAVGLDGRWLSAAGQRGVFVWPIQSPSVAEMVGCADAGAYSLTSGPRGMMAAGCLDGSVLIWNNRQLHSEHEFLPTRLVGAQGVVYTVAISPNRKWLVAGDENGELLAWRLDKGIPQPIPMTLMNDGGSVYALAFEPHGRWLAAADAKGRVTLWDSSQPNMPLLTTFQASQAPIYTLAISRDGGWLAAGSWDAEGVVRLWNMANFIPGHDLPGFTLGGFINRVFTVAFSPDGRWLAAGSADFTLRQWDMASLAPLDPETLPTPDPYLYSTLMDAHTNLVYQAVYSLDSRWLLSASADSTVRQWDATQPTLPPVSFPGHTKAVRMLDVTPDGNYAISASEDGTLRRWALNLDTLVATACEMTMRDLTPEEIHGYLSGGDPLVVCPPLENR